MKLLLCLVFALLLSLSHSLPTGAPISACKDLLPVHRQIGPDGEKTSEIIKVQQSSSPYTVSVEPGNINSGGTVNVSISGDEFKGIMARAYDEAGEPVNGRFSNVGSGVRIITCDSADDTATHTSPDPKSNLILQWTSPADYKGKVVFLLTVLKDYATFWQMHSGVVTVSA